jgi:hypothetical protein
VNDLHPHPSYLRCHVTVPASKLSALTELGDLAFQEPLVITRDRTIIDGYARWQLAQLQGRATLPCLKYELSEAEALHWLIQRHRRSSSLNDFSRILLAIELEPWFKEKARSNQRAGGQNKGSSKLTEAESVDVRSEIANAAGVSVGNVSKVKQLTGVHPDLLQALRSREISIHRAWLWSKLSLDKQQEKLMLYRDEKGLGRTIRALISRHKSKGLPPAIDPGNLLSRLAAAESSELGPVHVGVIAAPGRAIFLTEQLVQELRSQQE